MDNPYSECGKKMEHPPTVRLARGLIIWVDTPDGQTHMILRVERIETRIGHCPVIRLHGIQGPPFVFGGDKAKDVLRMVASCALAYPSDEADERIAA